MTEKRFTHKKWYNDRQLFDGDEPFAIVDVYIQAEAICSKLNELAEENKELKSFNKDLAENLSIASNREISKDDLIKRLQKENEKLKKALLFFYDIANCECSINWKGDMEKGCKRFFNCTYEEAEEKYGDYDGMWWELE